MNYINYNKVFVKLPMLLMNFIGNLYRNIKPLFLIKMMIKLSISIQSKSFLYS